MDNLIIIICFTIVLIIKERLINDLEYENTLLRNTIKENQIGHDFVNNNLREIIIEKNKKINDLEYERNIRSNDKSFERIDIEDNDYPVKYKKKTSLN